MRRRRDSHPSIHLPRDVNFPGTKIAGAGFNRLARGREEIVARCDGAASDPRRRQVREPRERRSIIVALVRADPRFSVEFGMLTHSSYGKERVRLVQVLRRSDLHDLRDLTIAVRFEGDYDASYTDGDNSAVLPTDTMKNTVYALAAMEPVQEPESFGQRLARHFLEHNARLTRVTVDLVGASAGAASAARRAPARPRLRPARPRDPHSRGDHADRAGTRSPPARADLVILKSAHSAFAGFPKDEYTTLPETRDRLLATSLDRDVAVPASTEIDFGPAWHAVKRTMLDTFAEHRSESVQHTLHAMGQAVLDAIDTVASIRLVMPNRHHLPFDLARFGLENRNEIFVATEEPHGLIAATLVRREPRRRHDPDERRPPLILIRRRARSSLPDGTRAGHDPHPGRPNCRGAGVSTTCRPGCGGIDAGEPGRPPGPRRHARPHQRAGPDGMGRLRARDTSGGRRRRHDARGHAAQQQSRRP